MKMTKALRPITGIAKFTLMDEVRHKSFIIMFILCAVAILLVRSCYQGSFMVNGRMLDNETIIRIVSKAIFHITAAGAMLLAALLSMRVFKRDREDGMQSCILSKPITRQQYVAGKVLGLWGLSLVFMFVLHSVVFIIASVNLRAAMPEYLMASALCFFNLLFVVVAVLLFSLLMPDIMAFLCVMAIGTVSYTADGIFAISRSQMVQAMMPSSAPTSDVTGWTVLYYLWPKLSGTQHMASLLIGHEAFRGFASLYPLINVSFYVLVLGALLLWRFRNEDII